MYELNCFERETNIVGVELLIIELQVRVDVKPINSEQLSVVS